MSANLNLKNRILLGYSVPIFFSIIVAAGISLNANRAIDHFEQEKLENQERQEKLAEIKTLSDQLIENNDRVIASVNQGDQKNAVNLLKQREDKKIAENIAEVLDEEVSGEIQQQEANILSTLTIIAVGGSILSTGISFALAFAIASAITKIIDHAINQVASSSTEIASTVEQQERTVNEQASSVSQTTTTMDELGSSSRQSAEQAEASASGARQALSLAEEGTQAVQQTMEGMSLLKEKVHAIAEQIISLSEQTGQIGGISELVAEIANQTNILALNAAVEAAHAGEQGQGFSVVAEEIHQLAQRSKTSADKINELVTQIQAAINRTVMVTDEGTKTVDQGLQLAQGTVGTFTGVTDAVNNVFLNSQQISLSAKQQAVAIQQMLGAMKEIDLGAKETASGITQVRGTTEQLREIAQQLKGLV